MKIGKEKREVTVSAGGTAQVSFSVIETGGGSVPTPAWVMVAGGGLVAVGGGVCSAMTWSLAQEGADTVEEGQQLKNANIACGAGAIAGAGIVLGGTGWALRSVSVTPMGAAVTVSF